MSRRRYKSDAQHLIGDTAYIANRLPWQVSIAFGAALFTLFYWLIPAWLESKIAALQSPALRPAIESILARRLHWSKWVAFALGIICLYFAIRSFLGKRRGASTTERRVGFFSRLLAKLLT